MTYLLTSSFSSFDNMPKYKGSTCDADELRSAAISTSRSNDNECACCVASQRLLRAYVTNISMSELAIEKIVVRSSQREQYYQENYTCESLTLTPEGRATIPIYLPENVGSLQTTDFTLMLEIFSKDVVADTTFSEEVALNYFYCG